MPAPMVRLVPDPDEAATRAPGCLDRFPCDRVRSDRALRNAWQPPPGMCHGLGPDESLIVIDGPPPSSDVPADT